MISDDLKHIAAIKDPVDRAREITLALAEHQALINELARMRREAVTEAQQSGISQTRIARAVGVTQGRISQMRAVPGILTGWLVPASTAREQRITISGSRAEGTNSRLIDDAVRAVGQLLVHYRCRVTHGPVGVGIEVMTHIADHYRPPRLGEVTGVFGRANVIRDADFVLIVGGGEGTQAEFDLASSMDKKIVPWPASGGTAKRVFDAMRRQPDLRPWLSDSDLAALGESHSAEDYVRIVERLLVDDAKGQE